MDALETSGAPSERRPAALVTGASSGIGRALAELFAADGHELVLVARSTDVLSALAAELAERHGARAHAVPADLAVRDAPAVIAEESVALGLQITHLVNNAGFAVYGPFTETDGERERDMIRVNVEALTALTKIFVPGMVTRGRGRILNVASTAAFQPGPNMAVYYATKAYVLHFSVALAMELEGTGVTVTTLCPGPTRTAFASRAGMTGSRLFAGGRGMDVARVARAGYDGMRRGEGIVVPGTGNKALALATRLVPRGVAARIARRVQARAD